MSSRSAGNEQPDSISAEVSIKTAVKHYRKKKYADVVEVLSPLVDNFEISLFGLKLIGMAMINTGHLAEAKRNLQRALSANRNDPEVLNGLAYVELTEGNVNPAVNHLLDGLYVDQNNGRLRLNLERIKNMKDPKVYLSMHKPDEFIYLELPQPTFMESASELIGNLARTRAAKLGLLGLILLVLFIIGYLFYPAIVNTLQDVRARRLGYGEYNWNYSISINNIEDLVSERDNLSISLTENEIEENFYMIRENIQEGNRNMALYLINMLRNSNADEVVKERVLILGEFVPEPDVSDIDYNPTYSDVAAAPMLFTDLFVRWRGTIANVEHDGRDATAFILLINFVDEAVVDGVASVEFDEFVHVMNGEKVTVYGTVSGIDDDNAVLLDGYQIMRLD